MISNHAIDYRIYGEELQFVEIELDPNETAIAESGAFMMMDNDIQMNTIFGDGSQQQQGGLLGKLFSAGKRLLVGESLFMTAFTNVGQGKKRVSFAAPYTGKIIAFDLQQLGGKIIAQKDAFLFNTNLTLKQQSQEVTKLQSLIDVDNQIIALRTKIKKTSESQHENGVISTSDYLRELNAEDASKQNLLLHQVQLMLAEYNHQTTTGN